MTQQLAPAVFIEQWAVMDTGTDEVLYVGDWGDCVERVTEYNRAWKAKLVAEARREA